MRAGTAEIIGRTPERALPDRPPPYSTWICETDKLCLPAHDPDMEEIIRVCLRVHIRRFRMIGAGGEHHLAVYGCREIELTTTSAGIAYRSAFSIPFGSVLLLDQDAGHIGEPRIAIADMDIASSGPRDLSLTSLLLLYPVFRPESPGHDRDEHGVCCNIELHPCSSPHGHTSCGSSRSSCRPGADSSWP